MSAWGGWDWVWGVRQARPRSRSWGEKAANEPPPAHRVPRGGVPGTVLSVSLLLPPRPLRSGIDTVGLEWASGWGAQFSWGAVRPLELP